MRKIHFEYMADTYILHLLVENEHFYILYILKRNVQKADFGFVKRYQNYSLFDLKKTQNALKGKTIELNCLLETF